MGRVFRLLGAVLALALVVATGAPVVDSAHAEGHHGVFATTSDTASDSHHDQHQGLCAAVCVAPVLGTHSDVVHPFSVLSARFFPADDWASSHFEDGPEKPPRV